MMEEIWTMKQTYEKKLNRELIKRGVIPLALAMGI